MVGKLLRTLYGTRDAASQWDAFFNEKIATLGYDVGMSSPCFYGQFSNFQICFCGRDSGNLKFDSTNKQATYLFSGSETLNLKFCDLKL